MKACKQIGIKEVDCIVKRYNSEEEEIRDLVNLNLTRDRTSTQKAREAAMLELIEKKLARERQATLNNETSSLRPNSATAENQGRARDIVAKKVGFKSGQEAERAMRAVRKVDELKERGETEKAYILQGVLDNRNPCAIYSLFFYAFLHTFFHLLTVSIHLWSYRLQAL